MPEVPEFHPEKFRGLIQRKGEPVRWWKAGRCPCYDPVTGGHNPQCPLCGGKSIIYTEQAVPGYRVLMQGVSEQNQYLAQGLLVAGDVIFTTMPDEIPLGEHDLVALSTRQFRHSETVVRGSGDRDKLKWSPVAAIEEIRDMTRIYAASEDYELAQSDPLAGGSVLWRSGRGPERGTTYAVIYCHFPVYIVLPDVGLKRRTIGGVELPQRVYARIRNPERLGAGD